MRPVLQSLFQRLSARLFGSDASVSKELFAELKPYVVPFRHPNAHVRGLITRSYSNLLCSKLFFILGPLCLKHGVDLAQAGSQWAYLLFLGYGVCFTSSTFFESRRNLLSSEIGQLAVGEILGKTFRHLLELDPEFHHSQSSRARLFNISKAQQAIDQNLRSINQFFVPLTCDLVAGLGLLLANCGLSFCAVFMASNALYGYFTIKYTEHRRQGVGVQRKVERRADILLSEALSNYVSVKFSGTEQFQCERYQANLQSLFESSRHNYYTLGLLNTGQRFIFSIGITANLLLGTSFVLSGALTTGDLVLLQSLMLQMVAPLFFLGVTYRAWFDSLIDIRQLYKITTILPRVRQRADALLLANLLGAIQFRDVVFRYGQSPQPQLNRLSFRVEPGEMVALVGRSGAGKSTVLNLLFRLADPQSGSVLLDGHDLRALDLQFRRSISVMPQYSFIANQSAEYNLLYGNTATLEKARLLCQEFELDERLLAMPEGYQSYVGDRGGKLSGGEKQRLCLVRTLLRQSPVLVLDEPTSALDKKLGQKLLARLRGMTGRTRIVITHNPEVMRACDRVIELDQCQRKHQ